MTDPMARYDREREYHDERYQTETRGRAGKYYAVDGGRSAYFAALETVPLGARALEYGCGKGSAAFDLAGRGIDVVGIDISPVAIAEARAEAQRRQVVARFEEMNAEALLFDDQSFDVACGSGVLHHLDLDRSFPEIARVLRPGGWALFIEPLGSNPVINLYRRLTPKMRTADEHPLVGKDFETARRHFRDVSVEVFNLLALAGVLVRHLPFGERLIPLLHRADRWLFRRLPVTQKLAWVTVVRLADPRSR